MIVCPRCKEKLIVSTHFLLCDSCQYKAEIKDEIYFFAPELDYVFEDYNSFGLDNLFTAEEKHFWFRARKNFIKNLFLKYVNKNEKIIEIGAGTGNVSKMLIDNGYHMCVGEVHKNGLLYAKRYGIKDLYQFDLMHSPFHEHFDVVGMFDVLEHIEDDGLALRNIKNMLKPGGKLIIVVPAHKWLWSWDDVIANHKRRYDLIGIKSLFDENGFKILEAKNFFVSILPLLFLRTKFKKDKGTEVAESDFIEYSEGLKINPLTNFLLYSIMRLENYVIRYFSPNIGGSIAVVACKE